MRVKKTLNRIVGLAVNTVTSAVSQTSNKKERNRYEPAEGIIEFCRTAAAEGVVMLKNENHMLPLKKGTVLSVFGRCQADTFLVGYGSGGDVNAHTRVNIINGLKTCPDITVNQSLYTVYQKWLKKNKADNGYWGHWPMSHPEMPVSDALCLKMSKLSDSALVIIGRAAGEDRENTLTKGSYYLTEKEEQMLSAVTGHFQKVCVVMNIGGIMDFSWVEKYPVTSLLILWQGGMETGNALADVLSGKVAPSGCLTDTIATSYQALPTCRNFGNKKQNLYQEDIFLGYRYFETFAKDRVLYPFGFGLTYSSFSLTDIAFTKSDKKISLTATCKNTGRVASKKVIQMYVHTEDTPLCMPRLSLIGYTKTKLLSPGESQTVTLTATPDAFAAFDDSGETGFLHARVLQKGSYTVFLGFSCRELFSAGAFTVENNICLQQLSECAAPKPESRLMRLQYFICNGKRVPTYSPAPCRTTDLRQIIIDNLPKELPQKQDFEPDFHKVACGEQALEDFVAALSHEELEALSRGDYTMNSPLGAKGNAGVFGGVLPSLRDKGVLPLVCTDGPSGIRLAASSALLPNGTSLACAYNTELVQELYAKLAEEMLQRGSDVLLAPGMNLHRDPLCGRNFEYFSEDPVVTGYTASAVVKGLQSKGVSACPKHFACNNQETNRIHNDSVLSQRALRELYLRGFEICVKEAKPLNLMTSYNKVNGVWSHYHYELVTRILRQEWGYEGNVMTDWWMRDATSPEFKNIRRQAYRVRAGVDVLMPGGERTGKRVPDGTLTETLNQPDGITLAELQQTAIHVLRFALCKTKR